MDKHNRIPRNWSSITAKCLIQTNAGGPGDVFTVIHGEYGYGPIMTNTRTGRSYQGYMSHLRDGNCYEILEVV